ncbi:UDP-glucose--hexose-1-phosphate uridylyltransferase [Halobacillus shinanisalinarum]|uniref:Galactose-1-phosphate uridylyltransferase n=1 Tax=Halobacillus shinanisalinarum TaxID=2932258 RepID=A0ABY4H3Z6_9BACI|nr:UDP-glucose--hexose-1-phosphate uridylyltransferase [Halobacillus shinanisalinarum]UOQ94844.1 UDP-glucose--hexose-1-phosphate uridylyltransferase [Halobacillus shinanisalinarum]
MTVNIYKEIDRLIHYGLHKEMMAVWDIDYVRNALLELFQLEEYQPTNLPEELLETPIDMLENMLDYAVENQLIPDNTVIQRDLFDPKIMDKLIPRPSEVIRTFYHLYQSEGPVAATDYFYQLAKSSHYIRTDRVAKNVHWYSPTSYGDLEITINLSKPEKDPKAIEAAKAKGPVSYPKCLLCKENVGYAGRMDHPARQNHRIIPMELQEERWFLQYSPYVYYNEHAIVFSGEHRPMKISWAGFERLLHFVEQLPHYFVGSNADLPIVGGSILSHDHFQAGHHEFPMAQAPMDETFNVSDDPEMTVGIVNWPMSVIRLQGNNREKLARLGERILQTWKGYSDERVGIFAETEGTPHNTITPIVRMRDGLFELDLVLRNNRTNEQYPMGIFHPHQEVHHIKKENIGLIEVMGLAVLPGRLVEEMDVLSEYMLQDALDTKGTDDDRTAKHVDWAKQIRARHEQLNKQNIKQLLKEEIGRTFSTVLEHAGVFKRTTEGQEGFRRFLSEIL